LSFAFPSLVVRADDGTTTTATIRRVDLIHLERAEKISTARIELGLDMLYKLAWLSLQRARHPMVAPHHDMATVSRDALACGASALAEIAEVEVDDDSAEPEGKASGQAAPTG
jgi:hypothetical protein